MTTALSVLPPVTANVSNLLAIGKGGVDTGARKRKRGEYGARKSKRGEDIFKAKQMKQMKSAHGTTCTKSGNMKDSHLGRIGSLSSDHSSSSSYCNVLQSSTSYEVGEDECIV